NTRFSRDWSSDVCSSDLREHRVGQHQRREPGGTEHATERLETATQVRLPVAQRAREGLVPELPARPDLPAGERLGVDAEPAQPEDRKSVVQGKRAEPGGA